MVSFIIELFGGKNKEETEITILKRKWQTMNSKIIFFLDFTLFLSYIPILLPFYSVFFSQKIIRRYKKLTKSKNTNLKNHASFPFHLLNFCPFFFSPLVSFLLNLWKIFKISSGKAVRIDYPASFRILHIYTPNKEKSSTIDTDIFLEKIFK